MKKIFLVLIIFSLLIINKPLFTQWVAQYNPSTLNLQDVSFINRYTGWACADGGDIVKTTNGGINWVLQNSGISGKILTGIHAVDSQYVYCVGWWQTILKTTNGGTDWIIIRNGPPPPLADASFYGIVFLNRTTGWMLRNNYILRTTNGGSTFDSTYTVYTYIRDVYFKDALTGVLCGEGALVMKSTDEGVSWSVITMPLSVQDGAPDFYKISFIGNFGWVVGRGSNQQSLGHKVFRTINFGSSWDSIGRVPMPIGTETYCCFFSSQNIGWSGGSYGHIFKTTNSGFNWYEQVVPSNYFRRSIWMFNDNIGWAVGGAGQILITTNGGTYVGIENITENIPSEFMIFQNYPNPFNSQSTIVFEITDKDNYKMEIYNVLGQKVDEFFNEYKLPGRYRVSYNAENLASGVYFYTLSSSKNRISKSFILIK